MTTLSDGPTASADAAELLGTPPLSIYLHLPWCVRRCPYCDFNSHALRGTLPEADYVDALLGDVDLELQRAGDRRVDTLFFGGGTPSLFGAGSIARVLRAIERRVSLEGVEITLEVNPGTVERGRFADYASAGINRVSLGVQSFDPTLLRALGRIHSTDDVWRALDELGRAGISEFNLDLMYGLPGQDPDMAASDLAAALRADPAHLSYYQLTIEPNTLFHRYPPSLPDDVLVAQMEQTAGALLADAGLFRYEVSAWAQPGRHCRHNENYWRFGDYLGVGAGAHGKLTDPGRGVIERRWKLRRPDDYMAAGGDRTCGRRSVDGAERVFEYMLNALRLVDGFTELEFTRRTGLAADAVRPELDRARSDGLLERPEEGHWRPTAFGLRFLDDLQARFLAGGADD